VAGGQGVIEYTYEKMMAQVMGSGRVDIYGRALGGGFASTPAVYADSTGRQVKVHPNVGAIVRGFKWESGAEGVVRPLEANTSGNPRIDLVVLRLDRSEWTVRCEVVKGTPATTPVPPVPRQTYTSTDVYDLPLATVRVASSGVTGAPNIAAGDVIPVEWWTGPNPVIGRSTNRPGLGMGQPFVELDTSRAYLGTPRGSVLFGENGDFTKVAPGGGWDNDNIYCWRVNGLVWFQCQVQLAAATRPANTGTLICTLPVQFRPPMDIALVAYVAPGQVGRVLVDNSTGRVALADFPGPFPKGGYLATQALPWPSREVLR
jgi:hypothetical protein